MNFKHREIRSPFLKDNQYPWLWKSYPLENYHDIGKSTRNEDVCPIAKWAVFQWHVSFQGCISSEGVEHFSILIRIIYLFHIIQLGPGWHIFSDTFSKLQPWMQNTCQRTYICINYVYSVSIYIVYIYRVYIYICVFHKFIPRTIIK